MANILVPPGSLKLRASCDACATSKVKCDKDQPSCRRCVMSGNGCIYGISRKHGKQVHRRRVTAEGSVGQPVVIRAQEKSYLSSDTAFDDHMQCESSMGYMPRITNDETGFHNLFPSRTTEDWSSWMEQRLMFGFDSSKQDSAIQGSESHYEGTVMSASEDTLPNLTGTSVSSEAPSFLATPESFSSLGLANTAPDFRDLTRDPQNHKCYSLASDALKVLNLEAQFGCAKRQAEGIGLDCPPLTIAHILEANQTALHTLKMILDCPCSEKDAPLAFLNASIVSKINHWYKVGSRIIRSAIEQPSAHDRSFSSPYSTSQIILSAQAQCVRTFSMTSLATLPISVGTFDIDAENRAALSRQLLLSELNKTARLIEKLQRKAKDTSDNMMSSHYMMNDAGSVSSLYSMLSNWLREEVARTTYEVQSNQCGPLI